MDITGCLLTELVDDPMVGLVMKSDRVDRSELKLLLQRLARKRLRAKQTASDQRPRLLTPDTVPCSRC